MKETLPRHDLRLHKTLLSDPGVTFIPQHSGEVETTSGSMENQEEAEQQPRKGYLRAAEEALQGRRELLQV